MASKDEARATVCDGALKLKEGDLGAWIEKNTDTASLESVRVLELIFDRTHGIKIGDSIGRLSELTELWLRCRKHRHLCLPDALRSLQKLDSLVIFDSDIEELPVIVASLTSLRRICLCRCRRINCLPNNLSKLTSLHLTACESLTELPAQMVVNLKHLCLSNCHPIKTIDPHNLETLIIREGFSELPLVLDGLEKLRLRLIDVRFSRIKYLPWSISRLPYLQLLLLPSDFRLETLPFDFNDSVLISVEGRHVRKSCKQLKQQVQLTSSPVVGGTIPPPGYLRVQGDAGSWIFHNYDSRTLVRILDLESPYDTRGARIFRWELPGLTHLYVSGRLKIENFSFFPHTLRRITHLSLHGCGIDFLSAAQGNLSNLETLDLLETNLLPDMYLPISLIHLCLHFSIAQPLFDVTHPLFGSIAKLSNLKTLDLYRCHLDSLPAALNIVKLKVTHSTIGIKSLPTSLHHLEILHFEISSNLQVDCRTLEECLNKLVNLEMLSITCYRIKSLPSIAGLINLQELQLKDCFSLKRLPPNVDKLLRLCTLNISGTRIKSLPIGIMKLPRLRHLILSKCFKIEILPSNMKEICIIDPTDEMYYKLLGFYDSRHESSTEKCYRGNEIVDAATIVGRCHKPKLEQGVAAQVPGGNKDCVATIDEESTAESPYFSPRSDKVMGEQQRIEIPPELIRQFFLKTMRLVDASTHFHGSSCATKRKSEDLETKRPSSKRGKHIDAKKRKHNTGSLSRSIFSKNLLVNATDPVDGIQAGVYIVGSNQFELSKPVLMKCNAVNSSVNKTIIGKVKETLMATQFHSDGPQAGEVQLDGANECTLSNIVQKGSLSSLIVKATYQEDTVRFNFSLTHSIDQLKEEVGKRLELDASTFKIRYQDEEKQWMLLTCISDLEHALHVSKLSGSNVVRLSIIKKK